MKTNNRILNIPPHISTPWRNVDYLEVQDKNLIIHLTNGKSILIPGLSEGAIRQVFACHADSIEDRPPSAPSIRLGVLPLSPEIGSMINHNPAGANLPVLPPEVTAKLGAVADALGLDLSIFQVPEDAPDCNCPYCQIARAVHPPTIPHQPEDIIDEDDLRFRDWDVQQIDENRFEVAHPFDNQERYQVFLGNPIGCTCGKSNCEHIRAVLLSSP